MRDLDFSFEFEPSPLEIALLTMGPGDALAAERLLLMLEGEDDGGLELAYEQLAQRQIAIDLTNLPPVAGSGALRERLQREKELVDRGALRSELPKQSPLRLCMEDMERAAVPITDRLIAQAMDGDPWAVEELVAGYFSEILECACRLTGRGVLLLDLIQEGSMGLLQALAAKDPAVFRREAKRRMELAMAWAVVLEARAEGIGAHLTQAMENYRKADRKLLGKLGRNPTVEEIALELGKDMEQTAALERMYQTLRTMSSLLRPAPQEADEEQAVEHTAYFQSRQRIGELLSTLPPEDGQLLRLRFGLDGGHPLSPEDTGRRLGLTAQAVLDREAAALALLRQSGMSH